MNLNELEQKIVNTPDFPKPGVVFKDIFPMLKEHFNEVIDHLAQQVDWSNVDYIVGIESRGFILGCGLATKVGKGFIPIRKKGKLPPPTVSESYSLEYGEDVIEMAPGGEGKNIVILDDVLATGGTMKAALNLCSKADYQVQDILVLMNLEFLNDFNQQIKPVKCLWSYK